MVGRADTIERLSQKFVMNVWDVGEEHAYLGASFGNMIPRAEPFLLRRGFHTEVHVKFVFVFSEVLKNFSSGQNCFWLKNI